MAPLAAVAAFMAFRKGHADQTTAQYAVVDSMNELVFKATVMLEVTRWTSKIVQKTYEDTSNKYFFPQQKVINAVRSRRWKFPTKFHGLHAITVIQTAPQWPDRQNQRKPEIASGSWAPWRGWRGQPVVFYFCQYLSVILLFALMVTQRHCLVRLRVTPLSTQDSLLTIISSKIQPAWCRHMVPTRPLQWLPLWETSTLARLLRRPLSLDLDALVATFFVAGMDAPPSHLILWQSTLVLWPLLKQHICWSMTLFWGQTIASGWLSPQSSFIVFLAFYPFPNAAISSFIFSDDRKKFLVLQLSHISTKANILKRCENSLRNFF